MEIIASIILGIVLGITEFVPVSSLGHSLVLSGLLNFPSSATYPDPIQLQDLRNALAVFIQIGAVLAVLVYYSRDLLKQAREISSTPKTQRFWLNILIAFVPVGILGLLFNSKIQSILFHAWVVGLALIVGGVILLIVEQIMLKKDEPAGLNTTVHNLEEITPRQALIIGVAQVAALIPGVSRSGSTIVGGLVAGLDRSVSAIFSFYLFIPTLGAASGYELFKILRSRPEGFSTLFPDFVLAAAVGFIVSLAAIHFFLSYIRSHSYVPFGVYRIIAGVVILVLVVANVLH